MAKFIFVVLKMPSRGAKLLIFAKMVLDSMTGNPRFINPSPGLGSLASAIKAVEDALKGSATDRRAADAALRDVLRHLADYVRGIAESQAGTADLDAIQVVVESAGMRLRKVSARPKAVFAASNGAVSGSVDLTAPASRTRDPHEWGVSTVGWTTLRTPRRHGARHPAGRRVEAGELLRRLGRVVAARPVGLPGLVLGKPGLPPPPC